MRSGFGVAAAVAAATTLLVACSGGGGGGNAATTPTSRSTRELAQAASAMRQVTSYRFAATVGNAPAQVQLTGEFQAPDRVHETVALGGRPSGEVIFVGNQAFVRDPKSGVWRNRVQGTTAVPTDVRAAFAALTNARSVTRRRATYTFAVPPTAARYLVGATVQEAVTGTAQLTRGHVTMLSYRATIKGRTVNVLITYSDFDHAPPVTQPATA